LSADPGSLVPVCIAIINIYDQYGAEEHEDPVRTYGFTILPVPSTHRRFVSLVPENVKKRTGYNGRISREDGPSFLHSYRIFYEVFQFRKLGIASFQDFLTRHEARLPMFYGYILTDGVSMNFVFARIPPPSRIELYAPDFNNSRDIIGRRMNTIGLDPGRRDIITTASGIGDATYATRQVSTIEYQAISGAAKRSQYLEIQKATTFITNDDGAVSTMENLESTLPTLKTASTDEMRQSIQTHLSYLNHASTFYGIDQSRRRFKAYQGTQRTIATTANIVLNGGKKFDRNRRNKEQTKRNRKHRRNKTKKRRRNATRRQELIKAQYYAVAGQISQLRQQMDLVDGAIMALEQVNAFDTSGFLEGMRNQRISMDETHQQQVIEEQRLQYNYLFELGGR
ncbi:hypothetical protein, partial, partial [Absidia glauca]